MLIKSTVLAASLALFLPFSAQAQTTEQYKEYQVSCNSASECGSFDVIHQESTDSNEVAQRTRRSRRRRSSVDKKFYVGGNLGLFVPFDDGFDVGFGPGVFGGYKFNKNISVDAEFFIFFGGTETDDLGYNTLAFMVNPRYTYFFSDDPKSIYAYASPGIGVGRLNPTGDVADDNDLDGETGFTFQIKAGAGYPINDSLDIFGQLRYFNVLDTVIDDDDLDDEEGFDGLTFDAGVTYNF